MTSAAKLDSENKGGFPPAELQAVTITVQWLVCSGTSNLKQCVLHSLNFLVLNRKQKLLMYLYITLNIKPETASNLDTT